MAVQFSAQAGVGAKLQINQQAFQALGNAVKEGGEQALKDAVKVMRIGAQELRRRVQRVSPVKEGHMRQSWQVHERAEPGKHIIDMGTSVKSKENYPYPLYLELGTHLIAGGAVMAWQPGDPPITEWKAKLQDIPSFKLAGDVRGRTGKVKEFGAGKPGSPKFERSVKIATGAFTGGQGEQMPMIRPVAWELMPVVLQGMIEAAQKGLKTWMEGKKFGK